MAFYRAQMRYRYFTGLPGDLSTNTVYWSVDTSDLEVAGDVIGLRLAPGMEVLGSLMPTCVSRSAEIAIYAMADPEPRVPFIYPVTLDAATAATGIPLECALVGSFMGAPPVTPRRRGRIYIGPLSTNCLEDSTSSTFPRPEPTVVTGVADIMEGWAADGSGLDEGWYIHSVTNSNYVRVEAGFVDNEFDTQRRRGVLASGRTSWP
jgi:hypothetical protein